MSFKIESHQKFQIGKNVNFRVAANMTAFLEVKSNLKLTHYRLDGLNCYVLCLIDGTRTVGAIVEDLNSWSEEDGFHFSYPRSLLSRDVPSIIVNLLEKGIISELDTRS